MTFCGQALPFLVWRTVVQVLGCSLPVEKLFWLTLRRHKVDPAVIRAYAAPFPSPARREYDQTLASFLNTGATFHL